MNITIENDFIRIIAETGEQTLEKLANDKLEYIAGPYLGSKVPNSSMIKLLEGLLVGVYKFDKVTVEKI